MLVFAELLRAFGARSETKLVHEIGLLSNLRLFVTVAVSFGLQIGLPLIVLELLKWLRRSGTGAMPNGHGLVTIGAHDTEKRTNHGVRWPA